MQHNQLYNTLWLVLASNWRGSATTLPSPFIAEVITY